MNKMFENTQLDDLYIFLKRLCDANLITSNNTDNGTYEYINNNTSVNFRFNIHLFDSYSGINCIKFAFHDIHKSQEYCISIRAIEYPIMYGKIFELFNEYSIRLNRSNLENMMNIVYTETKLNRIDKINILDF